MRWIAVACAVAGLAVAAQAATATLRAPACRVAHPSAAYTARIDAALRAGRDVLGERLLAAPGGPSDAAARRALAPLAFARSAHGRPLTDSGVYYVPFAPSAPPGGTGAVSLHVADGSEIVADHVGGARLKVGVGPAGDERFGSCRTRLSTPALLGGWLPALETRYVDAAGNAYRQESFAGRLPGSQARVAFVSVAVVARHRATVRLAVVGGGALVRRIPAGATATVYGAWRQSGRTLQPLDADSYAAARAQETDYWRRRLDAGASIVVPEARVQNAERALLLQNLVLGWRYSIGNPYEEFSYPEGVDVAEVMADWGFDDTSAAILETSLTRPPRAYANWRAGEELVAAAQQQRLFRDDAFVERVTPRLATSVAALAAQLRRGSLLARERYSSDIGDSVLGLHSQAVAWQGLREMGEAWRATGHGTLAAQATALAARLERGLRRAARVSERRLDDRSLFLPVRLLDDEPAYNRVTSSRDGSYWNLVAPYALGSGLFAPGSAEARGALAYLRLHGSRLLGLVRAGAFALYGKDPPAPVSGTDEVYGMNVARFLADNDVPDEQVLSLYGQLGAAMTPGTFVAGEAASVAPLDGVLERAMYLPPNAASNATFLEKLRLALVHERPTGLDLAFATPRAWLAPGRRIAVDNVPTSFGPVSFEIERSAHAVHATIEVPEGLRSLRLRLRLPSGARLVAPTVNGARVRGFHPGAETLALPTRAGTIDLVAAVR
jgi:hypothetical protein